MAKQAVTGINFCQYSVHNDGSIRGETYRVGDLAIIPELDATGRVILSQGMQRADPVGLEIVTSPYPYEDMRYIAEKFTYYLASTPQTPRTSIHVHVDVGDLPWTTVKNVVLWAHALEAPLYRIACGGGIHRGARMYQGDYTDHKYARPLSSPIYCAWSKSRSPVIDWDQLISSDTASKFAASWGRLDMFWTGERQLVHYSPHRLHMINLASVLRQGTLEWRLFDGLYNQLTVFVEVVNSIHNLAMSGPPEFEPMLLGTTPDISADWISQLLNTDINTAWGTAWQDPCRDRKLFHHYQDVPVLIPVAQSAVQNIYNRFEFDSGESTFPMFRRSI